MESTNLSLTDLSDIILPAPIPFWPLGQGAYLLCIAVVIMIGLLAYLYLEHNRVNRYRRVGLSLLTNAESIHDVSVVLKRVALAVFPRDRVASLYGDPWLGFLGETCQGCKVKGLGHNSDTKADAELIDAAGFWIRNHRVKEQISRG